MIDPEKIAPATMAVFAQARQEAKRNGNRLVGSEHVLLAIAATADAKLLEAMSSCGLEETRVRQAALNIVGAGQPHTAEDLNFTPRVERLITKAFTEAESLGRSQIEPKHLLIAILREDAGIATRILERTEVRSTALLKVLLSQ